MVSWTFGNYKEESLKNRDHTSTSLTIRSQPFLLGEDHRIGQIVQNELVVYIIICILLNYFTNV